MSQGSVTVESLDQVEHSIRAPLRQGGDRPKTTVDVDCLRPIPKAPQGVMDSQSRNDGIRLVRSVNGSTMENGHVWTVCTHHFAGLDCFGSGRTHEAATGPGRLQDFADQVVVSHAG